MARIYLDYLVFTPLYSIEQGVGIKMMNERKDVLLVQYLLKAIMNSNKTFLGTDTRFTPPPGDPMQISGLWDEASQRHLARWEQLRSEAKTYWSHGHVEPTQFPGTVVPYSRGGKKIMVMKEMCHVMFGKENYDKLTLPGSPLPPELAAEFFWDPIRR